MPIRRVAITHNFGILSQTHQLEIKRRLHEQENGDSNEKYGMSSENKGSLDLEKCLEQLHEAENEEVTLNILEKLDAYLQKIKFQLKHVDLKQGTSKLEKCWKELFIISTSKVQRVKSAALSLLYESLVISPLSRQLLSCLLDISVGCLQLVYIDEQTNSPLNRLLLKVAYVLSIRLYYHLLIKDYNESSIENLKGIHTMKEGLKKILDEFKINPINFRMLETLLIMMDVICFAHLESCKSTDSTEEVVQFKINTLPEKSYNKLFKDSLQLWYCIKREQMCPNKLLCDIENSKWFVKTANSDCFWLDEIIGICILCQCAKLQEDYMLILLQLGKQFQLHTRANQSPWQLLCVYLECLGDIVIHGRVIEIRKIALLGTDLLKGLVDYLCTDEVFEIQYTCYQLLYDLTNKQNIDEGLRANVWHHISKFESKQLDKKMLSINKVSRQEISIGSLYERLSTSLSVVYFADAAVNKTKDEIHTRRNNFNVKQKSFDKNEPVKKNEECTDRNKKRIYLPHTKESPANPLERIQPFDRENELYSVVTEHFHKEKLEDEIERMKIESECEVTK